MVNKENTYRETEKLPSMPSENDDYLKKIQPFNMTKCFLDDEGRLINENGGGISEVLSNGFFLLKIPKNMNVSFGDKLMENFYKPKTIGNMEPYTGFKELSFDSLYEGYFDREHDQWENLYIERKNWLVLPENVSLLAKQMAGLGISILKEIFLFIKIDVKYWGKITNGLTDNKGHQMIALNHYRSKKNTRGCKFHRDSGWVTVLRSFEPGLLAYIDNNLWAINPEEGYFIINFGSSIEVLTEYFTNKVHANVHGVVQTYRSDKKERHSYAMFLDSDISGDVYRYLPKSGPVWIQSMVDFAEQEVKRTYDYNHTRL